MREDINHVDRTQAHHRPGSLRGEAERDAFFGLYMENQLVRRQLVDFSVAEEDKRRAAKLNHDVSISRGKMLTGADIKWNAGPTPVIDINFHRNECFGTRVRCDMVFFAASTSSVRLFRSLP